jgi:hypothetical protein
MDFCRPGKEIKLFRRGFAFAGTVVLGGRQVGVRCQIMREGISQRTRLPEDSSRKGGDAHPLMRKSVATTW